MWLKNLTIPAILTSIWILHWVAWYTNDNNIKRELKNLDEIEQVDKSSQNNSLETDISFLFQNDSVKNQIFVCLNTDDENSYMYTNVLESISNPENTVLELPISQLFKKYWNNKHPLYVSWVSKNFRALIWKNWLEMDIPQWFSTHTGEVTSETAYLIDDTLRFSLINPELRNYFPENLWDQLKEPGFEWFINPEDTISWKDSIENLDSTYDIVVKRVPSWKYALGLYRDWKIFMVTYVSVWLNSRQTRTWQFQIEYASPYKRSYKYDNAPMPFALNYSWWFFFHQWNVTWNPASHWCVRLPGGPASILYSLVKNKPHTDVFISNNLYKQEK